MRVLSLAPAVLLAVTNFAAAAPAADSSELVSDPALHDKIGIVSPAANIKHDPLGEPLELSGDAYKVGTTVPAPGDDSVKKMMHVDYDATSERRPLIDQHLATLQSSDPGKVDQVVSPVRQLADLRQ